VQLIGMLDSPYVLRVVIALLIGATPFIHRPISLFRHIDEFSKFNPLLKVPTLLTDDGIMLLDSSVILDHLAVDPRIAADAVESVPAPGGAVGDGSRPNGHGKSRATPLRAYAAPSGKAARALGRSGHGSVDSGFERALDSELPESGWTVAETRLTDITVACALRASLADVLEASRYPNLGAFYARAEALTPFRAAPPEDGAIASVIGD
jgi:glutathione S-transferase